MSDSLHNVTIEISNLAENGILISGNANDIIYFHKYGLFDDIRESNSYRGIEDDDTDEFTEIKWIFCRFVDYKTKKEGRFEIDKDTLKPIPSSYVGPDVVAFDDTADILDTITLTGEIFRLSFFILFDGGFEFERGVDICSRKFHTMADVLEISEEKFKLIVRRNELHLT